MILKRLKLLILYLQMPPYSISVHTYMLIEIDIKSQSYKLWPNNKKIIITGYMQPMKCKNVRVAKFTWIQVLSDSTAN